jgi:hypothetical protein
MKTYYFVGGPIEGQHADFLERLEAAGGVPPEWRIYPHVGGDDLALHVVEADSEAPILAHHATFDPIYRRGPIVEVVAPPR